MTTTTAINQWDGSATPSTTFQPGPLEHHRSFLLWSREPGATTATIDHHVYGSVTLDDAIGQAVRDLEPGETPFELVVTEGPTVRALVRLTAEGPTVERFDQV
ncbi:hypothetical protein [Tautonia rosea]|uniref:hypothetical protein n=1 Tax=Tautonia rosea TaxID=2728037 RepID=UPI001476784A|nr:hypothetical protein [Tautonia rosea]